MQTEEGESWTPLSGDTEVYIPQGGGVDILHLFSLNRHVLLNRVGFMGVVSPKQFIKFHYFAS